MPAMNDKDIAEMLNETAHPKPKRRRPIQTERVKKTRVKKSQVQREEEKLIQAVEQVNERLDDTIDSIDAVLEEPVITPVEELPEAPEPVEAVTEPVVEVFDFDKFMAAKRAESEELARIAIEIAKSRKVNQDDSSINKPKPTQETKEEPTMSEQTKTFKKKSFDLSKVSNENFAKLVTLVRNYDDGKIDYLTACVQGDAILEGWMEWKLNQDIEIPSLLDANCFNDDSKPSLLQEARKSFLDFTDAIRGIDNKDETTRFPYYAELTDTDTPLALRHGLASGFLKHIADCLKHPVVYEDDYRVHVLNIKIRNNAFIFRIRRREEGAPIYSISGSTNLIGLNGVNFRNLSINDFVKALAAVASVKY